MGWRVPVIWEYETSDLDRVASMVTRLLGLLLRTPATHPRLDLNGKDDASTVGLQEGRRAAAVRLDPEGLGSRTASPWGTAHWEGPAMDWTCPDKSIGVKLGGWVGITPPSTTQQLMERRWRQTDAK